MNIGKVAENLEKVELSVFRKQVNSFPDQLREHARRNMTMKEDVKQRDLQDFQMVMIGRLEIILRNQLTETGKDFRKFTIGGYDGGVYERFFRIQPAVHMTKPQFTNALIRCFGERMRKSEGSISKMFDSFDLRRQDEMDWRAFLYLLTIAMQPDLPCEIHLRYAYALYASSGSFDLECRDKLSIGTIKNILAIPINIGRRSDIRAEFDESWMEIAANDWEAINLLKNKKMNQDPDDLLISFRLYNKILHESSFRTHMQVGQVFGAKDNRAWTYAFEEYCYHPIITTRLKILRRQTRNEDEVRKFISANLLRVKAKTISMMRGYVARRHKIRLCFIECTIRWKCDQTGLFFDMWRAWAIHDTASIVLQRVCRGFLGRRRGKFTQGLQKNVKKIQAAARQLHQRLSYHQLTIKRIWGAVTIQKNFRRYAAKRRVASIVGALYDTGVRVLRKRKKNWVEARRIRALVYLQMVFRRSAVRRRVLERQKVKTAAEYAGYEMDLMEHQKKVAKELHRQGLYDWFENRRLVYDKERSLEGHCMEEKRKLVAYRNRGREAAKIEKERVKAEMLERTEEIRIEKWLSDFEEEKIRRANWKGNQCRACLIVPETPDEVFLKQNIIDRMPKQIKAVLRRADKQKIPMEVWEAKEVAQAEIIADIVEEEVEKCRQEGKKAAEDYTKAALEKEQAEKLQLAKSKRRKRKYACVQIQAFIRGFLSRRIVRKRAYLRYGKLFDPTTLEYYYIDKRTRISTWKKPVALGTYDIDSEDSWVSMRDSYDDVYYYNIKSWKMQFEQPSGTVMCETCHVEFAILRFEVKKLMNCENCANNAVAALMADGVSPLDITYRPCPGNKTTGQRTNFFRVVLTNWQAHLLDLNPKITNHQMAMKKQEEEIDSDLSEEEKEKAQKVDPYLCSRCSSEPSCRTCNMCNALFCLPCYEQKHKKPPWTTHTFKEFNYKAMTLRDTEKEKAEKKIKVKGKKRKKSSKVEGGSGKSKMEGGGVLPALPNTHS